jgi:SAM-dependent methyltransferase
VRQSVLRIPDLDFDYEARALEPVAVCNLCGSTEHVQLTNRDRYGYPATMRMCVRCGLGFLSPRLTRSEYAVFYEHVYRPLISAYRGRRIDAETLQEGQGAYARKLLRFLSRTLPAQPASLLDVGGSTGVVAGALCAAFEAEGTVLDPSPDELAVAKTAGLETMPGFVEDFDPGSRRWDLVLFCQTIDHVLDVAASLAVLRRSVAEGGHVWVDVDDLMTVVARTGSLVEAVHVDHPYYLTRDTARAFFSQAGFEIAAERRKRAGFLLVRGEPQEPDWASLRTLAETRLSRLRRLGSTVSDPRI